jgi:hypothetical protein
MSALLKTVVVTGDPIAHAYVFASPQVEGRIAALVFFVVRVKLEFCVKLKFCG